MLFGSQAFLEDAAAFAIANHFPEVDAMKQSYERRARALGRRIEKCKKYFRPHARRRHVCHG
jgi:hypothetical protein